MATEEEDIQAKIATLKGQISRHKNQESGHTSSASPYSPESYQARGRASWRPSRGSFRTRPYTTRFKTSQVHRNKTLILNGSGTESPTIASDNNQSQNGSTSTTTSPGWVTKTDRHLQLINPTVFEKQSQERAKAIEETRKLKLKQRDDRERDKLTRHLQRAAAVSGGALYYSTSNKNAGNYEIDIQGIRFLVAKNGSKLMKVPGDENLAKMTPKTAVVGGVRFYRSKNGNLYRSGIIKAQRRNGVVKKIYEPCRIFSTTGTCPKGPRCRYVHDPSKVAICKDFLQKGECSAGDSCDLSHDLTPERTPTCLHFAKGNCSNPNCRYSHIHVSQTAPVCRSFGIYGYCEKGATCTERHVNECPDFSNTGVCNTKGCKLLHRLKASNLRKTGARDNLHQENETSDLSSDDEADEIDSDDVDSDDLEEIFGEDDDEKDLDVPMQQDFIQL